jgi:hypothetical protein
MVREHRRGERRDLRKPCGRPIQRTPRHGRGFYPVFFIGRFRESGQQRFNDDPFHRRADGSHVDSRSVIMAWHKEDGWRTSSESACNKRTQRQRQTKPY